MPIIPNHTPTTEQLLQQKYNRASIWLFLISAFTAINVLSLAFGGSFYFLVSSSVPYIIVGLGMILCGMLPDEEYVGDLLNFRIFDKSVFTIFVIIAVVIIGLYVLSAILARKQKVGWVIFALVFFCLDTLLMFLYFGLTMDILIDTIFHVVLIVVLAGSVHAHFQLKKLPPKEQNEEEPQTEIFTPHDYTNDSPILRVADLSVKCRILLECNYLNHTIVYRRVKTVNELVIDGNVYSEYNARMEFEHSLVAVVDGHTFCAGLAMGKSFIMADGNMLKQKIRWI